MGKRGRKIMISVRKEVMAMIMETNKDGVKLSSACEYIGISTRTFQRWNNENGFVDKR